LNTYIFEKNAKIAKTQAKNRDAIIKFAMIILSVSLTAGLMIRKESVSISVISAIRSCGSGLIPTLFPFIVISDIFSKLLEGGKSPLALSFITGNVCGFPLGAKMLSDMYGSGAVTETKYRRYLPLCSNPGLIFTVAWTGMTLWGNYIFGCVLYILTLVSALLTFLIFSLDKPQMNSPATQDFDISDAKNSSQRVYYSAGEIFTSAVANGTIGMLKICGFVIFFSVLRTLLADMLHYLCFPDILCAFICSLLEISGGEIHLAEKATIDPALYLSLTFFAHAFGGICILAQVNSVIRKKTGLMKTYLLFKLIQGGICFILSLPYAFILYRM